MLFNSYIFIFIMLPLTLFLYFTFNKYKYFKTSLCMLLGMSLWFYGYFNPTYLLILCGSIVLNWYFSKAFDKFRYKKIILISALIFNIGLIFYFKYFDFFINNINAIFKTNISLLNIVLPLGISFFTFQQISYIMDSYNGKTKDYNFLQYAVFVSFFPQLVAGPIVLHNELIPQLGDNSNKTFNYDNFAKGLYKLGVGLFKKVIVADSLAKIVNLVWEENIVTVTSPMVWIASLAYTFQIYYDFSGYSDMAIGIGDMFNLKLPINFNSPYKACSIGEFWSRWHITLSRFLRQYIYYPLGGNKKGEIRTYYNLFIVFLVSGIWHGANWTFIIWGILHGIASIIQRMLKKTKITLPKCISWGITFYFINLAWIFFRAPSVEKAILFVKKLIFIDEISLSINFMNNYVYDMIVLFIYRLNLYGIPHDFFAIIIFMFAFIVIIFLTVKLKNIHEKVFVPSIKSVLITTFCYTICIIYFSKISEFLYFNF